jgi:hypothetical protein
MLVQASAAPSDSTAALQRALKEQRDRSERLTEELRDERALNGKLRSRLSRREKELRADVDAARHAAQEQVRTSHDEMCSAAPAPCTRRRMAATGSMHM